MRKLTKGDVSILLAYLLVIAVSAIGFHKVEDVAAKSRQVANDEAVQVQINKDNVAANQKLFCETSRSRWKVAHDTAVTFATPIPLPADTPENASSIIRTKTRNAQLGREELSLLKELGPEPKPC